MESVTSSGGQPGNKSRATQYRVKRTLEKLVSEASSKSEGLTKLETMCKAIIEKAEEGDTQAFREVADRLDGKPAQALEVSGAEGGPLILRLDSLDSKA
jgi:hypothetical protein